MALESKVRTKGYAMSPFDCVHNVAFLGHMFWLGESRCFNCGTWRDELLQKVWEAVKEPYLNECCPRCRSPDVHWVGYSPRAIRRSRPSKDVKHCDGCGSSWYYAKTGRELGIHHSRIQFTLGGTK